MGIDEKALRQLLDKEAIRELVQCYSRAVDRKDMPLLRDLYTEDATDTHGHHYDGSAKGLADFIEGKLDSMFYSGHHACNHMISVDGDVGYGEVYAIVSHVLPAPDGGRLEDFMTIRYIDNYRRCEDGKWRFSKRVVTYDMLRQLPFDGGGTMGQGAADRSYEECKAPLFQRGPRC
jgi:ketosteroid isomerase-like protein